MAITVTRLNPDEVLRYMGCPPEKADGLLRGQVERCAQELLESSAPGGAGGRRTLPWRRLASAWRAVCSCRGGT